MPEPFEKRIDAVRRCKDEPLITADRIDDTIERLVGIGWSDGDRWKLDHFRAGALEPLLELRRLLARARDDHPLSKKRPRFEPIDRLVKCDHAAKDDQRGRFNFRSKSLDVFKSAGDRAMLRRRRFRDDRHGAGGR